MSTPPSPLRTRFFTICAANYLANAIVLSRSVAAAHAGSRLVVFLLDDLPAGCTGLDDIDVVAVGSTMPAADWHHYQCFYTVLELATGVKPLCFEHLLNDDCDVAIYLDADIAVFGPFDRVLSAIGQGHEIVLTPHILTPLPADGKLPDDLAIMRAGIYNLGFAAFANAPRSRAFLAWWGRHLRTLGLVDLEAGLFTDQKWMDFAPAFSAATFVLRDPGYNVAYWNLHERTLHRREHGWQVDFVDGSRSKLVFFHFSGFASSSRTLSKHETRFGTKPPADTSGLLEHYADLLAAAGHASHSKRKVAEPRFPNGIAWDPICRILYRTILKANPGYGDPLQCDDFFRFSTQPALGDHVPRYVRAVLTLRPDVAAAYDDGRNSIGVLRWLAKNGARELGLDPLLLDHLGIEGDVLDSDVADAEVREGINYVGYFRSHLGVGEGARNAVTALRAAGVDVHMHDISHLAPSPTGAYDIDVRGSRAHHDITILGVNADETPRVLASMAHDLPSKLVIGSWAWETPDFPEAWCDRFGLVDEVWVGSHFIAEAVRAKATVPVFVAPYAVSVPRVEPDKDWLASLCPDVAREEFTFICFFDVASVPFRKNPQGAIAAFMKAFDRREPVRLIVKVLNGERDPDLLRSLAAQAGDHRVTILDAALDTMERFRLLASVGAFVSLHRSEGFGLVIAEAMAMARPVVVTNWSGNVDLTNADNAALVRYRLVRSAEAHGPYPAGTQWAEPDLDDAARQMRRVWEDLDWRNSIGSAGARTISAGFSPTVVGALLKSRLERLTASTQQHGRARRHVSLPHARALPVQPIRRTAAFMTVSRDMLRRPLYYVERAPRLPGLLASEGLQSLFGRIAFKAKERNDSIRRRSSLRTLVLRFWSRFRRPNRPSQ